MMTPGSTLALVIRQPGKNPQDEKIEHAGQIKGNIPVCRERQKAIKDKFHEIIGVRSTTCRYNVGKPVLNIAPKGQKVCV